MRDSRNRSNSQMLARQSMCVRACVCWGPLILSSQPRRTERGRQRQTENQHRAVWRVGSCGAISTATCGASSHSVGLQRALRHCDHIIFPARACSRRFFSTPPTPRMEVMFGAKQATAPTTTTSIACGPHSDTRTQMHVHRKEMRSTETHTHTRQHMHTQTYARTRANDVLHESLLWLLY